MACSSLTFEMRWEGKGLVSRNEETSLAWYLRVMAEQICAASVALSGLRATGWFSEGNAESTN